jgi:hypothetical protein
MGSAVGLSETVVPEPDPIVGMGSEMGDEPEPEASLIAAEFSAEMEFVKGGFNAEAGCESTIGSTVVVSDIGLLQKPENNGNEMSGEHPERAVI